MNRNERDKNKLTIFAHFSELEYLFRTFFVDQFLWDSFLNNVDIPFVLPIQISLLCESDDSNYFSC